MVSLLLNLISDPFFQYKNLHIRFYLPNIENFESDPSAYMKRFVSDCFIISDPNASCEDVLKNVRDSVDQFVSNAEQFDDLTMLCLEYKGPKADGNI